MGVTPAPVGDAASAPVRAGQHWQHLKRGTVYEIVGIAELQAGQLQAEHAELAIYRGEDGKLWARNTGEFTDGRFALAAPSTPPASMERAREWRCFHCDETFTSERCARLHFGATEDSAPACQIKAGAEGSILRALRDAETAADDAMQAVHNETTDAARAYHAQTARHSQALIAAEELGYERGLRDAREVAPPPVSASVERLREALQQIAAFLPARKYDDEGTRGYNRAGERLANIARAALTSSTTEPQA